MDSQDSNNTAAPVDKQPETIEKKPEGWGGFQTHPENINRSGRPKRKTLIELINDELEKMPNGEQNLARLILSLIFNKKDKTIITEYWRQRDGAPKQKAELTGEDDTPLQVEIIEAKRNDS